MTKKEIIIKSWMELNIDTPSGICDETGWFYGYFCNGIDDIVNNLGINPDYLEYDIDYDGLGKFRPKSLQGIENNNGWIKIESENDLPKEDCDCYYMTKHNDKITVGSFRLKSYRGWVNMFTVDHIIAVGLGHVTYYQTIIKPQPPIY